MRARPRRLRRCSIAAISVALVVLAGGSARAQNAEAEALFTEANKLFADRRFAEACEAFEASNRAEPRAGTLLRLGECREQRKQLASAWSAYKDALTRVKDRRKRAFAVARVKALEPRLSQLIITVADGKLDGLTITRDGKPVEPALWNRTLPVDGGDYVIAARAPGREPWQTTAHVAAEAARITVEVPPLVGQPMEPSPREPWPGQPSAEASAPRPPKLPAHPSPAEPAADDTHAQPAPSGHHKLAIAVGGVAVALAVGGAVLGNGAQGEQRQALALCPDPAVPCNQSAQADQLSQSAHRRALLANIAFGASAAAAIGAGVLWFTGGVEAEPRRVTIGPRLAPGELGLVVLGSF